MSLAKDYLKNSLGTKMLDTYWQIVLSGGGGGGGDKPWDEMTWDEVIAATKDGKYKNFEIGAMKELDLGTEGIVHMQIVGIDVDDLADGSGKAPLTFISKELLNTDHRMNSELTPSAAPYDEGTGSIGGWEKCEMRAYLKDVVKPLIPSVVRNSIKIVTKYSNNYKTSGTKVINVATTDDIWIPSYQEIVGGTTYETLGHVYSDIFIDVENRKKYKLGERVATSWWLRSASGANYFRYIKEAGSNNNNYVNIAHSVALGFCL